MRGATGGRAAGGSHLDTVSHGSSPQLVATKLRPHHLRRGLIRREELIEGLRSGRAQLLTLVCAPAGYGKTTLLAQWQAEDATRTPFAWISLDEGDHDPTRLWAHIIAGLHESYGRAGESSLPALASGQGAIAERVLPLLIEELAEAPPLVLVLDDWHAVQNPACDQTLSSFIHLAPEAVQVVVSGRSDPQLHVARLRAHSQLTEVRARDLRLSLEEATALVREAAPQLENRDIELLTARTEGWPAGLSLALLALKELQDPGRFVADLSCTDEHIVGYLSQDVLSAVTPRVRTFLLRTSVLDQLSPALCDAVLETSGSAAMLAEIERDNLFLFSLDDGDREYRCHQLFSAMLKQELMTADPDAVPGLHRRASAWHEENGDVEASIGHAIASHDVARASVLVTRHALSLWSAGRLATLAAWLEALSWPEAIADGQLALVRALVAGLSGRGPDELERWLAVAETGPDEGRLPNGMASLGSGVALLRSAYLTRGVEDAAREGSRAAALEPVGSPWRRPALVALGQALYFLDRHDESREVLEEAQRLPGARDHAPAAALGRSYVALLMLAAGDVEGSERVARDALALLEERHLDAGITAANPLLALGCTLSAGPDLHQAIEHFEHAVELSALARVAWWHAHALLRLAAAQHRHGNSAAAKHVLASARVVLDGLPEIGMLGRLYDETIDDLLHDRRREGFLGDELSDAELRILRGLVKGRSVATVARELWLSQNTVKSHRRSIYRKLGIASREELRERTADLRILDRDLETRTPWPEDLSVGEAALAQSEAALSS